LVQNFSTAPTLDFGRRATNARMNHHTFELLVGPTSSAVSEVRNAPLPSRIALRPAPINVLALRCSSFIASPLPTELTA
jgi:hypothetical protein